MTWSGGDGALLPYNAEHVGLYGPSKDQWTEGKDDLSAAAGDYKYYGGVLLPDGRVVMAPFRLTYGASSEHNLRESAS